MKILTFDQAQHWIRVFLNRFFAQKTSWEYLLFFSAALLYSWAGGFDLPDAGLDPSWAEGLVNATDNGRVFGRDIVFTFGPFHQLYTHQTSANLIPLLFGRLVLGISAGAAAVILARMSSLIWGFTLVLSIWLLPVDSRDGLASTLAILFILGCLLASDSRSSLILIYCIYSGLILAVLTKLSFLGSSLPAAGGGFAILFLDSSKEFRFKVIALLASVVSPIFALWSVSGQPINGLFSFLGADNFEVVRGYSSAMQMIDSAETWQPIAYCLSALLVIAFLGSYLFKLRLPVAQVFLAVASLIVVAWVVLKSGMTRHDGHVVISALFLFTLTAITLAITQAGVHRSGSVNITGWLLIPMVIALQLSAKHPTPKAIGFKTIIDNFKLNIGASLKKTTRDYLFKLRVIRLTEIRRKTEDLPIPPGASVDIIPWDISDLTARGYRYSPRPVIQSYSAYSPKLQILNANHFSKPDKPDFVVLRTKSIDGRTNLEMDAPALLSIAKSYSYYSKGSHGSLIFKKNTFGNAMPIVNTWKQQINNQALRPIQELGREGYLATDWLPINSLSSGSYLQLVLNPAITRKLQTIIFRSPPLTIEILQPNHQVSSIRIVDQAKNLIALNPMVRNTNDLFAWIASLSGSDVANVKTLPSDLKVRIIAPAGYGGITSINLSVYKRLDTPPQP